MHELPGSPRPPHVLDEFVDELLGAGAVLSQIISQMVRYAAANGPVPGEVPIPDAAHELLAGVLADLEHRYSRRDLMIASMIVKEATRRICEEVYFIPLESDGSGVDRDAHRAGE